MWKSGGRKSSSPPYQIRSWWLAVLAYLPDFIIVKTTRYLWQQDSPKKLVLRLVVAILRRSNGYMYFQSTTATVYVFEYSKEYLSRWLAIAILWFGLKLILRVPKFELCTCTWKWYRISKHVYSTVCGNKIFYFWANQYLQYNHLMVGKHAPRRVNNSLNEVEFGVFEWNFQLAHKF